MAAQNIGNTSESPASNAEHVANALLQGAVGGSGPRKRARFHELTVHEVRPLTENAVEVTFAVPDELVEEYDYLPGQYVALRTHMDGRELRRSYSLCRPPAAGSVSVGIKRDEGGLFSTWAQTELHAGDKLDVMSPQGTFTSTLQDLDDAHVAGFAAGSGITPLMALATAMLRRSDTSRFTLIYTNRSAFDVMFLQEIADLKDKYPTRFVVHHVLSREQRQAELLSGRIDEDKLRGIVEHLLLPETVDEWFLCGPLELVTLCRTVLEEVGVNREHIRHELFTTGDEQRDRGPARPVVARKDEPSYTIDFTLDGQSGSVQSPVSAREAILDAAMRVRPDVPYACAGGVCGTCRALLRDGSVTMTENYALEPAELERGYILTCQSHPTTDRVLVDYDV